MKWMVNACSLCRLIVCPLLMSFYQRQCQERGKYLLPLSNFWFDKLNHVLPNHLSGIKPESIIETDEERAQLAGRALVVKRLRPVPIEAIVRGYLVGSAELKQDTVNPYVIPDDEIQAAAALLRAGEIVAFPTETAYGLGALEKYCRNSQLQLSSNALSQE